MITRARAGRIVPVFCCAAVICLAQSDETKFSTAVNLVTVPVVVRNARGEAVGTLGQRDFRLFDRGKLQTITKFSIEKTDATPRFSLQPNGAGADVNAQPGISSDLVAAPVAEHFLAWLFDDVHASFGDLTQTRAAALRMLKEPLDPATRLAVFTTSGRVTREFTGDRDKLAQAISEIRTSPGPGSSEDCAAIGYYQADRIVGQDDATAELAAEVGYAMNCLHPGPHEWRSAMIEAHETMKVLAPNSRVLGREAANANLGVLKDLIRRMALLPGTRNIVLVSPGFFPGDDRHDEETDLENRAIRANVVINSLNTRGVQPSSFGDVGTPQPLLEVKQAFDREQANADEAILENLADSTGGTLFHNDNGYLEGFRRSAARPEYIYVLGFTPQNLKSDGSFHKLKVTLRSRAGLQVQARRGYFIQRSGIDAVEQGKEEVKDALFSRDEIHDLPVELLTEILKKGDDKSELSIVAHVDLKGLHFRKADGRNNDTIMVAGGVFDQNGKYVTGEQKTINLRLTDEDLDAFPKQRLMVRTKLDVASGSYVVRLVVRDSEGPAISAQNRSVEIPR
jgi:VWFA-related protein